MQLKKELDPDKEAEGTFISFLEKLVEKEKGYTTVSNPKEVDYPDWTFKVLDESASILTDNLEEDSSISDILGDQDKSEKLEQIIRVTWTYNLRSYFISLTVTQKKSVVLKLRKRRKSLSSGLLPPPTSLVNLIINNARIALSALVAGNVL